MARSATGIDLTILAKQNQYGDWVWEMVISEGLLVVVSR